MSKAAKSINADSWEGKWPIAYSRAAMKTDSSESIGAGDVGNPYHSPDDASMQDLATPCPSNRVKSDLTSGSK